MRKLVAMLRVLPRFLVPILAVISVLPADAGRVRGYTRKDGTYVAPHYRSAPNRSVYDNWSTKGNVNPYTGKKGTVSPYPSYPTPSASPYRAPSYRGDVSVGGSVRADGTYVAPHMRSAPDRDPSNNWSTKGNVNPYTGEGGTKSPPSGGPYSYVPPVTSPVSVYDQDRKSMAEELQQAGVNVDWTKHTWMELRNMTKQVHSKPVSVYDQDRMNMADELRQLGVNVDWTKHTWMELYNLKQAALGK